MKVSTFTTEIIIQGKTTQEVVDKIAETFVQHADLGYSVQELKITSEKIEE